MDYLYENFNSFLINNKNFINSKKMIFESIEEEYMLIQLEKLYHLDLQEENEESEMDGNTNSNDILNNRE